jgi:hypothetical protein
MAMRSADHVAWLHEAVRVCGHPKLPTLDNFSVEPE